MDSTALINRKVKFTFVLSVLVSLSACGGSSGDSGGGSAGAMVITTELSDDQKQVRSFLDAEPYNEEGPHRDFLKQCYDAPSESPCTFLELPLIGQEVESPTVSDIMDRVIVSHDWMGIRLEQLLSELPSEALKLYKPVAVIYVGSDVDSNVTNRIRASMSLDPDRLWVTPDENTAIPSVSSGGGSSSSDFIDESDALQFTSTWYYTRQGKSVELFNRDIDSSAAENYEYVSNAFAASTYVILAFAANRMPESIYDSFALDETPADVTDNTASVAEPLYNDALLSDNRSFLFPVADVIFDNAPASGVEQSFSAQDIGGLFDQEGRIRLWAYSGESRDVASLFAAGMLKYKHDISIDVMFIEGTNFLRGDLIGYGQKNRIAAASVAPRAKFVMEKILGSSDELDAFFESELGETEYIEPGTTVGAYFDSIDPSLDDADDEK